MRRIFLSGYKSFELGIFDQEDKRVEFIKKAIEKRILELIDNGLEWVLISGQYGVELWGAEVVLNLKKLGYEINLCVIPPFENQETRWPEPVQQKYNEIIGLADFYQPLFKGDYKGSFQFSKKNKWLADKSDGCLLLMDEENPESNKFFLNAAKNVQKQKEYPILLITPFDLEDIVSEIQMENSDQWNE